MCFYGFNFYVPGTRTLIPHISSWTWARVAPLLRTAYRAKARDNNFNSGTSKAKFNCKVDYSCFRFRNLNLLLTCYKTETLFQLSVVTFSSVADSRLLCVNWSLSKRLWVKPLHAVYSTTGRWNGSDNLFGNYQISKNGHFVHWIQRTQANQQRNFFRYKFTLDFALLVATHNILFLPRQ